MSEAQWKSMPSFVYGLYWWNHKSIKGILKCNPVTPIIEPDFSRALERAHRTNGCVIGWASRITSDQEVKCVAKNVPLFRVEDGFLRSVGLGAGLAPAASLVIDKRGIYYDATRPSDLEWLLENAELDAEQLARSVQLRKKLVRARVSKYNLGDSLKDIQLPTDKPIILVPGQVTDDAAILNTRSDSIDIKCCNNINLELIKTVRQNNPDAYIIYKPHPDVVSKLRIGHVANETALCYVDRVIENFDIIDLIDACDKVETISSLSGFEALLRDKEVVVHGLPFYAGWGLTMDTTSCIRRTKKRSIDELTYLTLITYCQYVNPISFRSCSPEEVIDVLNIMRQSRVLRIKNLIRVFVAWVGLRLNLGF